MDSQGLLLRSLWAGDGHPTERTAAVLRRSRSFKRDKNAGGVGRGEILISPYATAENDQCCTVKIDPMFPADW